MKGKIVYGKVKEYYVDDRQVTEEEFEAAFKSKPFGFGEDTLISQTAFNHPSDALAVHPSQVKEAHEDSIKRGVRTEFMKDGRPIMRDRAHQKAYIAAYGYYNRNGCYGDLWLFCLGAGAALSGFFL